MMHGRKKHKKNKYFGLKS